jgi:hypothetical protein
VRRTAGWFGLGVLGTLWVGAHWRVASLLRRLDRSWDAPSWIEPIEKAFLVAAGVVASIVFVLVFQVLFRRGLAQRLQGVPPRTQVLVFLLPVAACLLASWRFRVMLVGPLLLLVLNLVQLARNLPPSTPAVEAFGWFGRTTQRIGKRVAALRRKQPEASG